MVDSLFKEASMQVFSCEYREIFQRSVFYRTPPVVALKLLTLIRENYGFR